MPDANTGTSEPDDVVRFESTGGTARARVISIVYDCVLVSGAVTTIVTTLLPTESAIGFELAPEATVLPFTVIVLPADVGVTVTLLTA